MFKKIVCLTLCLVLLAATAVSVAATNDKVLTISTAEQLQKLAENCRLDSYSQGLTVSLEADIDLSGVAFTAIPVFSGTFLGNGHMLTGLTITADGSEQGLFRYLTETARVERVNVIGKVLPGGSRSNIGGIAGSNAGEIFDCSFSGTIAGRDCVGGIVGTNTLTGIVDNCRVSGEISGNHFVGGIAGDNKGVVRYCENTAYVNTQEKQNSVDISDITVQTITGTEASNVVTDVGGIAGCSSGVIRGCNNYGNVGYPYMGYNIGGIAGSLTGYLDYCENYGAISGRKEVGGIVGQMEPAIVLQYETDAVQLLQEELDALGGLMGRLSTNIQRSTAQIQSNINSIETNIENAQNALSGLGGTTDPDSLVAAFQAVGNSVSGIQSGIQSLTQSLEAAGQQLETDLNAVSAQANQVQRTLSGSGENLGGFITDVSDLDTEEDLTGKVSYCSNVGKVLGDWNVGGIAGAMALENDLDPEQDVVIAGDISLNMVGQLRSVILSCENSGDIAARKQNAGGIVGWQSMGLVKNSLSISTLDTASAEYTGGIAGKSAGYIRNCSAKTTLSGERYVGGIAGLGAVVTDCSAMCRLSGKEWVGGILGFAEETDTQQPLANNVYLLEKAVLGGIDGIDYSGIAQGVQTEEFFSRENVTEDFSNVTVVFRFSDGTVQKMQWTAGNVLTETDVPQIPAVDGQLSVWQGLGDVLDTPVWWDVTLEAVHSGNGHTIAAQDQRDNKPVLLLQGEFAVESTLTICALSEVPALDEAVLLDAVQFTATQAQQITTARYLLPSADVGGWQVQVLGEDGTWRQVSHKVDGSYLVFSVTLGDQGFAVWSVPADYTWQIVGVVAAALLAAALIVVIVIRKKKK